MAIYKIIYQVYRPPRVLRRRKETAEGAEEKVRKNMIGAG